MEPDLSLYLPVKEQVGGKNFSRMHQPTCSLLIHVVQASEEHFDTSPVSRILQRIIVKYKKSKYMPDYR